MTDPRYRTTIESFEPARVVPPPSSGFVFMMGFVMGSALTLVIGAWVLA